MIQDADTYDTCCIDQLPRNSDVLRAGLETATGMVVDENHKCCRVNDGIPKYFSGMYKAMIEEADGYNPD